MERREPGGGVPLARWDGALEFFPMTRDHRGDRRKFQGTRRVWGGWRGVPQDLADSHHACHYQIS